MKKKKVLEPKIGQKKPKKKKKNEKKGRNMTL